MDNFIKIAYVGYLTDDPKKCSRQFWTILTNNCIEYCKWVRTYIR
jgi:hypothetical protein